MTVAQFFLDGLCAWEFKIKDSKRTFLAFFTKSNDNLTSVSELDKDDMNEIDMATKHQLNYCSQLKHKHEKTYSFSPDSSIAYNKAIQEMLIAVSQILRNRK